MKLISKLKKISVCSLLSAGTLIPLANVGLSAMYPSNAMNNVPGNIDEDTTMDVEEDVPSSNSAPTSQQHSTSEQQPKPAFTFGYSSEPLPESFTFGQQSVPTFTFGTSSKPAPAFTFDHQSFTQSFQSVQSVVDKINSIVNDMEREINLSKEEKIDLLNKWFPLFCKGESNEATAKKLGVSEYLLIWLFVDEDSHIKKMSQEEKADLLNKWFPLFCKGESHEAAAKKLGVSEYLLIRLFADEDSHIKKMSQEEKATLLNQWYSLRNKGESEESASRKLGISSSKIKVLGEKKRESKMGWFRRLCGH